MQDLRTSRLLLSATWEIEPRHGLQYLAAAEQFDNGTTSTRDTYLVTEAGRIDVDGFASAVNAGSIAHLVLSGAMMLNDGLCSRGIRSLNADLMAADANPNISGIVLEIDSGGGQTTAGTELQNAIKDITDRGQTQVVVYAQTLASAALRAAVAADYIIVASDTADVGSVGTMMQVNAKMLKEARESLLTIYARQSKMKNGPIRALFEGDEEPLIDYVSERAQGFIDSIERLRPGMRRDQQQVERLQSGDLFTGAEAAQIGLVDAVGTFADALRYLSDKQKVNNLPASSRSVSRLNANTMSNSNSGFISLLNKLFGRDIPEDATPDQAAEALADVNIAEDQQPSEQPTEQVATADQAMLDRVESLTQTISEQATTIASFATRLDELASKNEKLEQQLADAKLGNPAPTDNGRAADRNQFQTVQNLDKKFGAKYQ